MENKNVNVSVRIPTDIHQQFRIKTFLKKTTMQEYILNLIKEDLKKNK